MKLRKYITIIIIIGIIGFYSPLGTTSSKSAKNTHFSNNANDPFIKNSNTPLIDGRHYFTQYYDGYAINGLKTMRGIKTYLSWEGNYKPVKDRKIRYSDQTYIGPDNKTYVKYDVDTGRFKVEFTNFTNIITTSRFSFKQRPAEIGLYNWNTQTYINKENVSKAEDIIPNYQNKTLTYTEIFTNTDVKFTSNKSHIKEVFVNDGTVFWGYPGGWTPSDTYLVIFNELYDFKGIKLYDNEGEIIESKVINGILKLKSTELGEELLAYLPLGEAWAKFSDDLIHYTDVKGRIVFRDNKIYYASAISYQFVRHAERTGKLYIDPTWSIGKDGDAWANCDFFQTMENITTNYAHLTSPHFYGHITSPIEEAQLQWLRIQFNGDLHDQQVNIYWNSSQDLINWNMELVKENAEINTDYYFANPSKYGKWRLELYGISSPFTTPEIYNVTVFNDPPNNDDFSYYKEIEIDSSKVSGSNPHLDFPILININDTDLQSNTQSDGDDIAFSNFTHWLDHEIEYYNGTESNNLVAWVRIPALSTSVNTTIYMYYGNNTMGNQQNPNGVWNQNYLGIWHLSESSGNAKDSTTFDLDGILSGGVTQNITGQIATSYEFDRSTAGTVDMGDPIDGHLDFNDQNFTISFWVNLDYFYYYMATVVGKRDGGSSSSQGYLTQMDDDNNGIPTYEVGSNGPEYRVTATNSTLDQGWKYIVYIWDDSSTSGCLIYHNGLDDTNTKSGTHGSIDSLTNSIDFRLNGHGNSPSTNFMSDMILDEVRISNVTYNSDWILTEYNNQYSPDTFYNISQEFEVGIPPIIPPIVPIPIILPNPILALITLGILMGIMIYLYTQLRVFYLILLVFLFSLVFGGIAMLQFDIPFSPFLQAFFMLFQTMIFIITTLEVFKKR